MDSRQARLDAAIALFRSEASASGYVVEEIRLRLPVPDVDVLPRVIIAQQNAAAGISPAFQSAKQHRPLPSYPRPASSERNAAPRQDPCYPKLGNGSYRALQGSPRRDIAPPANSGMGAGLKRTVSGSAIVHPVPIRHSLAYRANGHSGSSISQSPGGKMRPLRSVPYMPNKDSMLSNAPKEGHSCPHNGQFWKTVIGSEKRRAILKVAKGTHSMRYGNSLPKFGSPDIGEKQVEMELSVWPHGQPTKPGQEVSPKKKKRRVKDIELEERNENTLHINGHNIPESHVQLLLNSAIDTSARERVSSTKKKEQSLEDNRNAVENKKQGCRSQVMVDEKLRGTRAKPKFSGRQFSKGRRESLDRTASRSTSARPFKCYKCPSSFDRDGHLRVHILAVHEKKRPFVCQVCDASFGHSSSLLRHVRTVHQASPTIGSGKSSRGRIAQARNDSGTTKSDIKCEDMQDDGEKPFRCSACGQAFNRVALLNRHVAKKHPLRSSYPDESEKSKSA